MKNFIKNPAKLLSVLFVTGTMILMSCSDSICPTYIDAITRSQMNDNGTNKIASPANQAEKQFTNSRDVVLEYNSNDMINRSGSSTI